VSPGFAGDEDAALGDRDGSCGGASSNGTRSLLLPGMRQSIQTLSGILPSVERALVADLVAAAVDAHVVVQTKLLRRLFT
jgi:hypothetical protein